MFVGSESHHCLCSDDFVPEYKGAVCRKGVKASFCTHKHTKYSIGEIVHKSDQLKRAEKLGFSIESLRDAVRKVAGASDAEQATLSGSGWTTFFVLVALVTIVVVSHIRRLFTVNLIVFRPALSTGDARKYVTPLARAPSTLTIPSIATRPLRMTMYRCAHCQCIAQLYIKLSQIFFDEPPGPGPELTSSGPDPDMTVYNENYRQLHNDDDHQPV